MALNGINSLHSWSGDGKGKATRVQGTVSVQGSGPMHYDKRNLLYTFIECAKYSTVCHTVHRFAHFHPFLSKHGLVLLILFCTKDESKANKVSVFVMAEGSIKHRLNK